MKNHEESGRLVICLEGRIDSGNAAKTEEEIKCLLTDNQGKEFLFDAENLSYISSAGLRILLAVRQITESGFTIRNVCPAVYDTLEVTGFSTFLNVKKKLRTISVEGCPVVGKGAIGEVYRLDEPRSGAAGMRTASTGRCMIRADGQSVKNSTKKPSVKGNGTMKPGSPMKWITILLRMFRKAIRSGMRIQASGQT